MRDMGRHQPPRLGCVRNATQVQGGRRNLNLVYKQVNENTFLSQTLRPIRRRANMPSRRAGAMPGKHSLGDREPCEARNASNRAEHSFGARQRSEIRLQAFRPSAIPSRGRQRRRPQRCAPQCGVDALPVAPGDAPVLPGYLRRERQTAGPCTSGRSLVWPASSSRPSHAVFV